MAVDLGILSELPLELLHLTASLVKAKLRILAISIALGLQVELLCFQLQYLVLRIGLSLLRVGKFMAAILDVAARRVSLRQEALEILDLERKVLDAIFRCADDLIKCRFERGEVLVLGS